VNKLLAVLALCLASSTAIADDDNDGLTPAEEYFIDVFYWMFDHPAYCYTYTSEYGGTTSICWGDYGPGYPPEYIQEGLIQDPDAEVPAPETPLPSGPLL
jgi:hypothetical protein